MSSARLSDRLPQLLFTDEPLSCTVTRYCGDGSLIITDPFNFPDVELLGQAICVEEQEFAQIEYVKSQFRYSRIVAVGGCTALDFGRACGVGKDVVAIPTILSTSCLSTNCSVIKKDGVYGSVRTQAPSFTVVNLPTIAENHRDLVKKWSISGLGDLFASVSASIEFEYARQKTNRLDGLSWVEVSSRIPSVMKALDWALFSLQEFDEASLRQLAQFLHDASLDVIENGPSALNAASEHWLYYKMQERYHYPKMIATHGKLVGIGTLIATKIAAEESGETQLESRLLAVYDKLGLPRTFSQFEFIGVKREHILTGLRDLSSRDCFFRDYFSSEDYSVVDRALV